MNKLINTIRKMLSYSPTNSKDLDGTPLSESAPEVTTKAQLRYGVPPQ